MNPVVRFYQHVLWALYLPLWVPIVAVVYLAAFGAEVYAMAKDWWVSSPWRRA